MDDQNTDQRKTLETFVVENDDLLELESRIGRFNIFDALGITHAEIRHSNFLAFILDPVESHGQGKLFLTAVLMDLLKKAAEQLVLCPLSPIDLDGADLRGVEIKRERNKIDLLITSQEPPFAVVIENKVDSQDHSNQLNRYSKTVKDSYPHLKSLYVYLTPDGDEPSQETDETWLLYTYADIHRVLRCMRDAYHDSIGDDVLAFLDHYLSLLESRFMDDEKLKELCRKIYKNHRVALETIWEHGRESPLLDDVVSIVKENGSWFVLSRESKSVDIVPKNWMQWLTPVTQSSYPFCVSIRLKEGKLYYALYVGPMNDGDKRMRVITDLRGKAPKIGFKGTVGYSVGGKWNRVSGHKNIAEWDEEREPDSEIIRGKVKTLLCDLLPMLDKIAPVLKAALK